MKILIKSATVALLMLGASALPSAAANCPFIAPPGPILPNTNAVFGDPCSLSGPFTDEFNYQVGTGGIGVLANEITVSGGVINGLTIAIYSGANNSGPAGQQGINVTPGTDTSGDQTINLSVFNQVAGLYTLVVTGTGVTGTNVSYSGNLTSSPGTTQTQTPLPAALPLFAGGLGFLGFTGLRRKRKKAQLALS